MSPISKNSYWGKRLILFPVGIFLVTQLMCCSASQNSLRIDPNSSISKDYSKVRSYPSSNNRGDQSLIDGVPYPNDLVGPYTHGSVFEYVTQSTLRINGQVYNISKSFGPQIPYQSTNNAPKAPKSDRISSRDSYSDPNFSSDSFSDISDDDTTPAPIQGAIDYVLMPLIFLAVSGPIFVIMYIVISSVEYKLAPTVQLKSESRSITKKHTYFDLNSMYNGARPFIQVLSRTLDQESCQQKAGCEIGQYSRSFRDKLGSFGRFYDYLETFVKMFVPRRYDKSVKAYTVSKLRQDDGCKFSCFIY